MLLTLEFTHIITFVDFQTDEFIVVNHSRFPDYEKVHGNVLCFPMQSIVPSRPLSCGTNSVFVGIIPPTVIAMSLSRDVLAALPL